MHSVHQKQLVIRMVMHTRAVQGLAGPGRTRDSESTAMWTRVAQMDKLGLVLKLRKSPVGLASPQVPASPREASPRVQKVGLVPALMHTAPSCMLIRCSCLVHHVPLNPLYVKDVSDRQEVELSHIRRYGKDVRLTD